MRETTPEFIGGPNDNLEQPKKFLTLDEMTDSDEEEMDVSSAEDGEPPRKRQATESATAAPVVKPQWSNPDPYTVLPPTDEQVGKRKDFVKMIRKAKNAAAQQKAEENNAVVANEDYISFGDLDFDEPPANAPRGPKGARNRDSDPALGNRKRTYDDEIIAPATRRDMLSDYDGSIVYSWLPLPGQNPTPWVNRSTSQTLHLATM